MPDAPHGSRDLSALIRMSLSKDGEGTKADAFSRWLKQPEEVEAFRLDQHSAVEEMLDKFSAFPRPSAREVMVRYRSYRTTTLGILLS